MIIKLYKKLFSKNKFYLFSYKHNSFFEGLYRLLAIIISPIFIKINPNLISWFRLWSGLSVIIIFLFFFYDVQLILIFFLILFIVDFTDGIVARYNNLTSFYGRFIDGLFDIVILGLLHITLYLELIRSFNFDKELVLAIYLFVILIFPIQHLILDRYSAIARWCNELKKKKYIKPYLRNSFFNKSTMALRDIQQLTFFCILIFYESYLETLIHLFFIVSLINSLFSISIYFYKGKKNFSLVSNPKDNNE